MVYVVCGKSTAAVTGGAHIEHAGRSFALCCPMCLQLWKRALYRFVAGARPQSVIDELLNDTKWKNPDWSKD